LVAAKAARRFLAIGREEGDPRWTGRAASALAPWWDAAVPPEPIRVLRATVRQSIHEFPAALVDLDRAVSEAPQDGQAWLTRASVLQVVGDYAAARISCGPLAHLARPLVSAACLASVASLNGGLRQSEQYLTRILDEDDGHEPALTRWALTLLAEMAARGGDPESAERRYRQALELNAPDAYLLASWSDFLLDQGRAAEVLPLLKDHTRADALLLRLALAENRLHDRALKDHVAMLQERFDAARIRGDSVHRREEAMFELHLKADAPAALELARANWQVQREPLDARILLEAATAAGQPHTARPAVEFVASNRLEDVGLDKLRGEASR
jgi:tetratricopeptide (TPR) repeat protein